MKNVCAVVAALVALQLCAAPVLATSKNCGNNVIDPGEECDGAADVACPGMCDNAHCTCPEKTFDIPSKARPANSPGTNGVPVTNPKLITQFGASPNLNRARYTRFQLDNSSNVKPDAILILIPGFEGGAGNFRILAQNLLKRINNDHGKRIEVWAFDRRTNQLEDTAGLDAAEKYLDPELGVNWLFGAQGELSMWADPRLPHGRRAVFYDEEDVPFLANWTNLVFSQDIDAVVNKALTQAKNKNVFLGGHSMGTAYTARYASTDFNITPSCAGTRKQPAQPGYAKLSGLVLLEGIGGSRFGALTDDSLDRIIAQADGGLYGAVRDNAARCVDGTTPCTIANEHTDCSGQTPPKCTLPTTPYASISTPNPVNPSSLIPVVNPRVCAQAEPGAIQSVNDLNTGQNIVQKLGAPDIEPDLAGLRLVINEPTTVEGGFGTFLDKDGQTASYEPFLAMSLGEPGPNTVSGLCHDGTTVCTVATQHTDCTGQHPESCTVYLTWKDILHGGSPPSAPVVFGPKPTDLSGQCSNDATKVCTKNSDCTGGGISLCIVPRWGTDKEVTRLDRVLWAFFAGKTNFTDWYFPIAGPSTTSATGVCNSGTHKCDAGNTDLPSCSVDADCSQAIDLDSRQLSYPAPAGRGRCDIENLTQAAYINIPVIAFSASQGLATVPGLYTTFAQSIGICSHNVAPSCDGATPRVIDPGTPNATPPAYNNAFPEFGGVAGGFEVYVNEGFSHLDACTAEDTRNDECTAAHTPYDCCTGDKTGTCIENNVIKPLSDFIARNIQ